MTFTRAFLALAVLVWLPVQAQVVQDDWLAPSLPDGGTAVQTGTNYTIRWTANLHTWFSQYAATADVTNVDLWFKSVLSPHIIQVGGQPSVTRILHDGKCLTNLVTPDGINVRQTLSYSWLVDVPPSALEVSTLWSFQFRPATPNDSGGEISSPQVVVREGVSSSTSSAVSSTTSASSTSSASTTPSAQSTSTTPSAQPTSQTTPSVSPAPSPGKSSGISAGAIAGIVIGAVAVLLLAMGIFLFFRRRRAPTSAPEPFHSPEAAIYYHTQATQAKHESNQPYPVSAGTPASQYAPVSQYPVGEETPPSHLPSYAVELPSNEDRSPRELRGNGDFGRT